MLDAFIKAVTVAGVTLGYTFENTGSSTLYVSNLLYETTAEGGHIPSADIAYAIPGDDGKLVVSKQIIEIPMGIKAESPEVPYLIVLQPGEKIDGQIILKNPVVPNHPYLGADTETAAVNTKLLMLQIGYVDSADIAPNEAVVLQSDKFPENHLKPTYGMALTKQKISQVEIPLPDGLKHYPELLRP